MDKRELLLVIFPLLQGASFAAVCFLISNAAAAATTVILAALFLSFSLHITYHYHVHFKRRSALANRLIDLAITVLAGLPFHYYQMLHWNHHKYDNALGDFASTWKDVGGRPVARNLLPYALLWPFRRDLGLREQVAIASREGTSSPFSAGTSSPSASSSLVFTRPWRSAMCGSSWPISPWCTSAGR